LGGVLVETELRARPLEEILALTKSKGGSGVAAAAAAGTIAMLR